MSGPPPPPPPGPPPPPYGQPPPYPPPSATNWTGILLGALLIGPILAVMIPVTFVGAASSSGSGGAIVIIGLVLPWLVGIALLFFRGARPWGVGILIGVALTEIVLGGSCYLILRGMEGG